MIPLPQQFVTTPIAHRALHDRDAGRPENSPAAIQAAIDAGYGIEIDVQLSKDGAAMVFHDYHLDRLTGEKGAVALNTATQLAQVVLTGGHDTIPTLAQVLEQVNGQVPILLEIKDQDGEMGENVGPLEDATAAELAKYDGPVAVMSFNPNSIAYISPLLPDTPMGLVTDRYLKEDWPLLPARTRDHLRDISDFERVGASFISHNQGQLDDPAVAALKDNGIPILCWTVRSAENESDARRVADNITFESYLA